MASDPSTAQAFRELIERHASSEVLRIIAEAVNRRATELDREKQYHLRSPVIALVGSRNAAGEVFNGYEYVSEARYEEMRANNYPAGLPEPMPLAPVGVQSSSAHDAECAGFLSANCKREDPHCCACDQCGSDEMEGTFIDLDPPESQL